MDLNALTGIIIVTNYVDYKIFSNKVLLDFKMEIL